MVETISPVVYGSRAKYWRAVGLHALGATLSAALFGAFLGLIGSLLGGPRGSGTGLTVTALALMYIAREALGLRVPLLDRRRQVPRWWREFFSPDVAAALYGLSLGIGFLTFLPYGTFTVVAVSTIVIADPLWGAVACAAFGLARGLSVALSSHSLGGLGVVERLEALGATGWPRTVNVVALATLGLAALATV